MYWLSSMSKYKLYRDLERAVELYNRLHGAEAQARIISVEGNRAVVEFTGTFCHTCGVRDWLEDLAYLLVSMGYDAKLVEFIEPEGEESLYKRIGVFTINSSPSSRVNESRDYEESPGR